MRVVQFPIPISYLSKDNLEEFTSALAAFASVAGDFDPLVDDGAGEGSRGKVTANPPVVHEITAEKGLLLAAKDATTLVRGLKAYPPNVQLAGQGSGLAVFAIRYKLGNRSKAGTVAQWAFSNVKQSFLKEGFKLTAFLVKHTQDFVTRKRVMQKVSEVFVERLGADHNFTFGDLRNALSRDKRLLRDVALLAIVRNQDVGVAEGALKGSHITGGVIRNLATTMTMGTLATKAAQAFNK